MKKWHEWAFIALLVALAIASGWLNGRVNLAEANIETNQG
jgi:hypothetical protein